MQGIGRRYIQAFEIGNEPDLYGVVPLVPRPPRPPALVPRAPLRRSADYIKEFSRWRSALPNVPLAGPAASGPSWMGKLGKLISAERRGLKLVTYHRYPLRALHHRPQRVRLSVDHEPARRQLLERARAAGWRRSCRSRTRTGCRSGLTEINSASCRGRQGRQRHVRVGAVGARHAVQHGQRRRRRRQLPHAPGLALRAVHGLADRDRAAWQAFVHPEYYGLLMFAQAFPPGARLLTSPRPAGRSRCGRRRAPTARPRDADQQGPERRARRLAAARRAASATGSLESLAAPSLSSTSGVTLGGQTFGDETTTGKLPGPCDRADHPRCRRARLHASPAARAAARRC